MTAKGFLLGLERGVSFFFFYSEQKTHKSTLFPSFKSKHRTEQITLSSREQIPDPSRCLRCCG